MKILITNDDGVNSDGIRALNDAVKDLAETMIVAPLTQQSGVGHAITLMKALRAVPTDVDGSTPAYGVTGTPTDSVILATKCLMDEEPDLIISGINVGENLATTITTSGTLGATFEAAYFGIPAIAISIQVNREDIKFKDHQMKIDYSDAQKILKKVVMNVMEFGMPEGVDILNINVPANPESLDIVQADLASKMYDTDVEKRIDPFGIPYYWIVGGLLLDDDEDCDVHVLRIKNRPTITPLSTNMTKKVNLDKWIE